MSNAIPAYCASELIFYAIIGYVYWSLVHGLGPMIWFYPLNELDITGYEVFVVACFSPMLFLINEKISNVLKSDAAVKIFLVGMLCKLFSMLLFKSVNFFKLHKNYVS